MGRAFWTRRQILATSAIALAAPALSRCGPAAGRHDVIVLGAGLAGLGAALELEAQGLDVAVVEARARPGGRCYTADDLPVRDEYGAVEVGGSYGRFRALAKRFGIAITPHKEGSPASMLVIGGNLIRNEDWPASPFNLLAGAEKSLLPPRLQSALLAPHAAFSGTEDWCAEAARVHDVSVAAFLRGKGASEEAIRLANVNSNNNGLETVSVLTDFRNLVLRKMDQVSERVEAGTARLPEAMAAALKRAPTFGFGATEIEAGPGTVSVRAADGRRLRADFLVVAIPLPALRAIAMSPNLPQPEAEAIANAPYTAVTQIYLEAMEPFWEADGLPPVMWTDGPFERFFPWRDGEGRMVGYKVWLNGQRALETDAIGDEEIAAGAIGMLASLRPASRDKVAFVRRHSWTREPYSGGAYIEWPAGNTVDWANALRRPFGRIHFAGEHTSLVHTGLEGALESGARTSAEVLARIAP